MPAYRSPYEVGPALKEECGEPAPRTAALGLPTAQGRRTLVHARLRAPRLELADVTGALS
jgi:hypothetical protein